ncbi:Chymotrypsin-like elastase family member 2A [Trichinella patagoniensis]|uniref:Chymotrypsin-like elastase family member 2A n=1 Tax=Trichinella patagoniensis TaxID=990121 RepID=A0A0V1A3D6_9BILA|nr:Chymotrypsin-like elastase family member 2A [Trichinella patagoniensis]
MMRFAFMIYFMNALELASTQIKCGMPAYPVRESDDNLNRIIGGWEVRPHSLPWQLYVLLGYKAGIAACGGTIIQLKPGNSTNLALTAAHCLVDQSTLKQLKPANVTVIAGAHNIAILSERTHKIYSVKSIAIHQNFKNSGVHDIALVILQSPILFSTRTQPICLPDGDEIPKRKCWVAGWGYTSITGDSYPVLLMTSTPTIFYGNETHFAENFRKYIFLAGSENGGAYRGDSGGPLFCKMNNVYVQYGIVSVRSRSHPPGSISLGNMTDINFGKYGVKINWICDAENGYALKGSLYTGRSSEERQIDLASTTVGQLAQPFVNSNRNVYMDCYFTSYSTVQHLFEHDLTAIGTVFAHRRDVLACLRNASRRNFYSTIAVYEQNRKVTMINYVPRKNSNNVLLLISCHAKLTVDNQQGDIRPSIMNGYNLGKRGVDSMDARI